MNATKHSRPADPAAAAVVAREADARAMKILKERLWHFTSIGLGNCRAAQAVEREIRLLTEGNKGSSQGNYSSDSTSGGNALANVARDGDAHGLKILKERLWHFTSIGLGNCRAAQQARREIEQQQQAHSGTGEDARATKNLATPPQHQLANQSVEQLTAGLSHLISIGLANSRAAQKISYELGRRLLIQIASLTNDDNFNPNEPRDQDGKWTTGTNASGSATNAPTQAPAPGSAPAQRDDDDDTDNIPLTLGEAHAKQRRSAGEASAQLYDEGRAGMKAAAATGRAAAEMNPIIAFFHGIYQALVGKDAIDPNKHLTAGERWKSGGSAALAAAPTGLKALGAAKVLVEAGEAAEGIKKAEGAIVEAGEIKKAESAIAKAEQAGQEAKKVEEAGAGATKAAEDSAKLEPYGGSGGGHHVPAKKVFEGDPNFHPDEAPAIPNDELARLGIRHPVVSGAQQQLYRAFAKTGQKLTWEAVENIETEALLRGGAKSETIARDVVNRAINALKAKGVKPTRIPWGN